MANGTMKVLVLGASGMLGHTVLRFFAQCPEYEALGTARSSSALGRFDKDICARLIVGVDVESLDSLVRTFSEVRPNAVINCVGVVKQLTESDDPLVAIPINSLLPHRLAKLAALTGARLIHISTDCVFSGRRGMYKENDQADAEDLYGRTKSLGEVVTRNAVTIRTSIIGHEIRGRHGLLEWFLSQHDRVRGYRRAVFSGLPTVELARVLRDFVLPNPHLTGLYHVSASPISKYELLKLIANVYGKNVEISPDDDVVIDRSLDSESFRQATGYVAPPWEYLVRRMHEFG